MKQKANENIYDVIIIGAGIGGLVCGCYLAKAGKKVLILEQHFKAGGYCASFKRKTFSFDAAAHSFGGYENGPLGVIFKELELDKKIVIKRFDPSDIISTPDMKISFWADVHKTANEFRMNFPTEKNVDNFFNFLIAPDPMSFARMRSWTFQDLLDKYFTGDKIKGVLSFLLFGNGGLPPSRMSAFMGAKVFKEFLFDGGYYPEGGMQELPNGLAERFQEFGGEIRTSELVKRIEVKDNKVVGVISAKNGFIPSTFVISNCDARQTFLKLLGEKILPRDFLRKLSSMVPTLSTFVLYLGLDESFEGLSEKCNRWFFSSYDLDKAYRSAKNGAFSDIERYLIHSSPDYKTITAYINMPFKNKKYWELNKDTFLQLFMNSIEKNSLPDLSQYVVHKEAATPYTLYRYTLNYRGAAYGWESTPTQFADIEMRKPSFVKGLYLTGHWTTLGLGIPGVTYVGYDTARSVLKQKSKDS